MATPTQAPRLNITVRPQRSAFCFRISVLGHVMHVRTALDLRIGRPLITFAISGSKSAMEFSILSAVKATY